MKKNIKKDQPPMPKKGMALSLLFLALFMSLVYVFSGPNKFSQTSYSDFMNALDQGQVSEVTISHDGTEIIISTVLKTECRFRLKLF